MIAGMNAEDLKVGDTILVPMKVTEIEHHGEKIYFIGRCEVIINTSGQFFLNGYLPKQEVDVKI